MGTRTAVCLQALALYFSVCFFCRVISSHLAPGSRTDVQGGPQPQCHPARTYRWSPTGQPAHGSSHRAMSRYNKHSYQISGCNFNMFLISRSETLDHKQRLVSSMCRHHRHTSDMKPILRGRQLNYNGC